MYPVIRLGSHFSIHTFGILAAAGVLASVLFFRKNAPRIGVSADDGSDLALVTILTGFAGARLFFVFQFWDHFHLYPWEAIRIWEGGIVVYGGLIAGFFGFFTFCLVKRLPFLKLLDLSVGGVAIAQGFGRIGCLLNGCCYGIRTALPWGVRFDFTDQPVHPVQLYESVYCFLLGGFLFWLWRKRPALGTVALSYFMLYPAERFLIEFLRGDNPKLSLGLTLPQWMSLGFMLLSAVLFTIRLMAHDSKRNSRSS